MCIRTESLVWSNRSGNLDGIEKSILSRIAHFANEKNDYTAYPSFTYLAEETGFYRGTVLRKIKKLIEKEYIISISSDKKSNTYQINVKKLEEETRNKKLSTKSVDNSVDNHVDNVKNENELVAHSHHASGSQPPVTPATSGSQPPDPLPLIHYLSIIDGGAKLQDGFKENGDGRGELTQQLRAIGVYPKAISFLIRTYGQDLIRGNLSDMRCLISENKMHIKNPGAFLTARLRKAHA